MEMSRCYVDDSEQPGMVDPDDTDRPRSQQRCVRFTVVETWSQARWRAVHHDSRLQNLCVQGQNRH